MHARRVLAGACLLALSMTATANAAKPERGCANDGFDQMTYSAFRQLSLDLGVPEELLGPEHEAGWNGYDRNHDGFLCVKDLPDTKGHAGSWVFNVVDNVANH